MYMYIYTYTNKKISNIRQFTTNSQQCHTYHMSTKSKSYAVSLSLLRHAHLYIERDGTDEQVLVGSSWASQGTGDGLHFQLRIHQERVKVKLKSPLRNAEPIQPDVASPQTRSFLLWEASGVAQKLRGQITCGYRFTCNKLSQCLLKQRQLQKIRVWMRRTQPLVRHKHAEVVRAPFDQKSWLVLGWQHM